MEPIDYTLERQRIQPALCLHFQSNMVANTVVVVNLFILKKYVRKKYRSLVEKCFLINHSLKFSSFLWVLPSTAPCYCYPWKLEPLENSLNLRRSFFMYTQESHLTRSYFFQTFALDPKGRP